MSRHTFSAVYRRTLGSFAVLFVLLTLCGLVQLSAAETRRRSRCCSWAIAGITGRPTAPRSSFRCSRNAASTSPTPRSATDLNPKVARRLRRAGDLRQHREDRAGAGAGPARLRRRGGGFVPLHCASFCFLQFAGVHRAGRRPVPAARHGRVRHRRSSTPTIRS